jgi:hypothetical protein
LELILVMERVRRITTAALVAAVVVASLASDACAASGVRRTHVSRLSLHHRAVQDESYSTTVTRPMRYYGGPKYPMWRG